MSEIVERGAVAMETKRRELINQPLARIWPDLMRAAIEAMREPTSPCIHGEMNCVCHASWRAMIDEMLK